MLKAHRALALAAGFFLPAALCLGAASALDLGAPEPEESLSAGAATSLDPINRDAFAHLSENMPKDEEMRFHLGRALFRKLWVAAPSSTQASDGLGPLFNARSCESCHVRDGRGHPPEAAGDATSYLLRLARPAADEDERRKLASHQALTFPDPVYGQQLQDHAVPALAAEGQPRVTYTEEEVKLGDGTIVRLRRPTVRIDALAYGPLAPETTVSARIAQPMIGLGLIEAIDEKDILAQEDPEDRDHDGIRGHAAQVRDLASGAVTIGRFGWKAQAATVRDQTAIALVTDIGISSPVARRPEGDCTPAEKACLERPNGVQPRLGADEAPQAVLDLLTFYAENLAVPARRKASFPETLAGKAQFRAMGCAACHRPSYMTRKDAALPYLGGQHIRPYSDLLLHDMGADLADGQQVGDVSGAEWRTPPLWGIGLTGLVSGHETYLHDGRARSLTEAILWHGGEAAKARNAFASANAADRQSLITFLESL